VQQAGVHVERLSVPAADALEMCAGQPLQCRQRAGEQLDRGSAFDTPGRIQVGLHGQHAHQRKQAQTAQQRNHQQLAPR
jgi:hypothetical protein